MQRQRLHRRLVVRALFVFSIVTALFAALPVSADGPTGKPFPPAEGTLWSDPQDLGDGQIQTFVTLDSDNAPTLVGVYFTENALTNLPETPSDGHWDIADANGSVLFPCCGHETVLEFPETDGAIPFKHFVMNWNPTGHPPSHVYDVPHFDLHFYTISNDDRIAIPAATADTVCMVPNMPDDGGTHPVAVDCDTFATATMPVPEDQMAPGYMSVGEVVPGMGNHLINTLAPELAGEPFTATWIYGAYDGKITFYEPMIANSFLQEKQEENCYDIAMPKAMGEAGYYPTRYCIRYMAGENDGEGGYAVSLESFQHYDAAAEDSASG